MSQVTLLAADQPLPLCASTESGLSVQNLDYYRPAVEELGLAMKPFQYELELEDTDCGARLLGDYLRKHGAPGARVELWNLWVGDVNVRAFHLAGRLEDLDGETLRQLREREQTCITLCL